MATKKDYSILLTALLWLFLFLPLCYFLVPPIAVLILLKYFSLRIDADGFLTRVAEIFARSAWLKKIVVPFQLFDTFVLVCFLYDYYQILKRFGFG